MEVINIQSKNTASSPICAPFQVHLPVHIVDPGATDPCLSVIPLSYHPQAKSEFLSFIGAKIVTLLAR